MGGKKIQTCNPNEMAVSLAICMFSTTKRLIKIIFKQANPKAAQLPSTIPTSFSSQPSDSITNGSWVTTLEYKAFFSTFQLHSENRGGSVNTNRLKKSGICWEIFIQTNRTWISWTLFNVQNHLQSHRLSHVYHTSSYFIMIISWASFSLQTSLQITKWVNGDEMTMKCRVWDIVPLKHHPKRVDYVKLPKGYV